LRSWREVMKTSLCNSADITDTACWQQYII
jgi:hypothetical protein